MLSVPFRHFSSIVRLRTCSGELRQRLTREAPAPLAEARRLNQLGAFERAESLSASVPPHDDADGHGRFLAALARRRRALDDAAPSPWRLVWQADPTTLWESDWIRALLSPQDGTEEVDPGHRVVHRRMIVVDNLLSAAKEAYYRTAFEAGATVVLFHLGDEWYRDDCSAYRWCGLVIRNYWSLAHDGLKDVIGIPLGYRAGFARRQAPRPAEERRFLWSFAGDPYKTTRPDMLEHMRRAGPGHEHLTRGFNSAACLPVSAYRDLLDDSVFAPAPCGNENLESFRVWEALEAGCIPIVEKRPGYDYFRELLGEHPLPTLTRWSEVGELMAALRRSGGYEARRRECQEWWAGQKLRLQARLAGALDRADARAGRLGLAGP